MAIIATLAGFGAAAMLALSGGGAPAPPAATPTGPRPVPRAAIVEPTVIGMNLGQAEPWNSEWIFADIIRDNVELIHPPRHDLEGLKTDAGGRPYDMPKGTKLVLVMSQGPIWRIGQFDCTISPGWRTSLPHAGAISGGDEKFRLTMPKAIEGNLVLLEFEAKQDNAKFDASCMPVGMPRDTVFNPAFLKDMQPFKVIRFMEWMKTNNATFRKWEDRPLPTDFSQPRRGMAVEYMVDLANRLKADPWFTLPMDADAAYYRNFAIYVRDHLGPGQKAYVELSNEVWNDGFQQTKDALARGKKLYPNVEGYLAIDYYYADRVRDFMKVWDDVFAGQKGRLVRVLGTQFAWKERTESLLKHDDIWRSVDAVAVAPYFGHNIQDIADVGQVRVDKVLARLPGEAAERVEQAVAQKAVVEKYGLRYVTYEGGPDVLGYSPDTGPDIEKILSSPRMYELYTNFLESWRSRVGGLMVLYDGTSSGSFGHLRYTGQPVDEVPKMKAVLDFMQRHQK